MSDNPSHLKRVIDASVSASKPDFADIGPGRIARLIEQGSPPGEPVDIHDMRGGGAGAGASSGIVVFRARRGDKDQRLVLRYAPVHNPKRLFSDYDIRGQFELQNRLSAHGLPVSKALWIDDDGSILGAPGYIMEHVEGDVADGSAFTGGLIADASDAQRTEFISQIHQAMGRIHGADWQALALDECVRDGGGRTPVERYLNWFWKTAEWTAPRQLGRLDAVRRKLLCDEPPHHPDDLRLVHGDPGLGNYMFSGGRIVCILDWELAGILHPDHDVAMQCSINDFFRAAATPDVARKIPAEADWIASYQAATGTRLRHFDYYRKLVTLPSLIVSLSMNRNLPEDMQEGHLQMLEPMWAMAEAN